MENSHGWFSRALQARVAKVAPVIAVTVTVLCACSGAGSASKADEDASKEAVKEAKTLFNTQKNAAKEGRFLNSEEVENLTDGMNVLADAAPAGEREKIRALASAVKSYRTTVEKFRVLGGADLRTIKSKEDVTSRQELLKKAVGEIDRIRELAGDDASGESYAGLDLERKILDKVSSQLDFYQRNYGKWTIKDGQILLDVDAASVKNYNQSVQEIADLQAEELKIMKRNADNNLRKLDTVK